MTDLEIQTMRCDRAILQGELETAGAVFKGKECRCIFHDDHHASAGIYEKDGAWKYKCHTCDAQGDIFDIRARLNKSTPENELAMENMRRMQPKARATPPKPTYPTLDDIVAKYQNVEAVYKYTDPATGKVELAAIRYRGSDGKRFIQASPAPGGLWWEKGLDRNPVYNRGRVASADTVVVVEGEKCVHALHDVGVIATTSPGGAKGAAKADWAPLAGKRCILWADNDEPGVAYMQEVARILEGLNCTVCQVDHTTLELPAKGDAADFVDRYRGDIMLGRDAVLDVLADARALGIMSDYIAETEKIIAGERKAIPFPWHGITHLARALMPGTVTCLFGPPGALKSYFMMECVTDWIQSGISACVFELEDDRTYHQRRAHAQLAQDARIMSNDWVEQNAEEFRRSREHFSPALSDVGRAITDAPDIEVSFDMLEQWAESRAQAGQQIIVIDPVTAVVSGGKVWIEDQKFIFRMKTLARQHHTRIILITHPRKGGTKPGVLGLDDMAGGSAYQRFAHTVLILERNEKQEEVMIRTQLAYPAEPFTPDLILRIAKARNGPGAGRRVALTFGSDTLRFSELGTIDK